MSGKEEVPSTPFSIQNILGNKSFDGVWTTILSSHQMDSNSGRESEDRNSRHTEWDAEALDMRMKNQIKGERYNLYGS
jgi:hypothetical protein